MFIDYNQNARDRTVASAYSVRANAEGRVSCPLTWDEIMEADPGDLTIATVPARFASVGDPSAAIDDVAFSLQPLLDLAAATSATASVTRPGRRTSPRPPASRSGSRRAGPRSRPTKKR